MKKFLFLTFCVFLAQIGFGKMLEIKLLNTPNISIDNKLLKVGDKFDERAKIEWAHENQAMKVLSEDKKLYILSPKLFSKYHITSFADYIANVKSTFVRNGGENLPVTVEDHKHIFQNSFILLDSLNISVGWKTDENSFFEATTTNLGDKNFSFIIPSTDNVLTIERSIFSELPSDNETINLTVKYIEKAYGETTTLTDAMTIDIVPLNLVIN